MDWDALPDEVADALRMVLRISGEPTYLQFWVHLLASQARAYPGPNLPTVIVSYDPDEGVEGSLAIETVGTPPRGWEGEIWMLEQALDVLRSQHAVRGEG